MGAIHYWRDYLKLENNNINTNDYLLTFYINNNKSKQPTVKFYFFSKVTDMIKFVKYVILPSFTYSKIINNKEDIVIEAIDYREMLNFFTISDKYYNKELIKRYSNFFNRLEDIEYGEFKNNEEEFKSICSDINNYFQEGDNKKAFMSYYKDFEDFKSKMVKKYKVNFDSSKSLNLDEKSLVKFMEKNNLEYC